MNVRAALPLLTSVLTAAYRSRYQPSYGDSGESRRSPRDQSPPGRYNDRDEFRGGSGRGSERRRSPPDARANHNAFTSNRETFRDPVGRESSRDFPPREPPRGPKSLIDAPTGPRASSYGSDYRGDFGGYRGEYRGDRSRGRGRGWRDDSRDRGREVEREYRDRRDDRGPPPPFRDDRGGRDRWGREVYRGRRPSSPPGRGRSPNYSTRDVRDPPPSIDLDRTRRGSRDGPLSGGSPSSENQSFTRGYGRARGGNRGGRGRGYYDEYHRAPGRSRSPDPSWGRRTQPSATPPPQVPAFGSASSNAAVGVSAASPGPAAVTTTSGLIPGVVVPTAPRLERLERFERRPGQPRAHLPSSIQLINVGRHSVNASAQMSTNVSPLKAISLQSIPANSSEARSDIEAVKHDKQDPRSKTPEPSTSTDVRDQPPQHSKRKRKSVTGKRESKSRKLPAFDGIPDELSDSDSADDFEDGYFEQEVSKLQEKVDQIKEDNPIKPREEPEAVFVKPIVESKVDEPLEELINSEPCIAPEVEQQPAPRPSPTPASLAPSTEIKGSSCSPTPLLQNGPEPLANGTTKESALVSQDAAAVERNETSISNLNGAPSLASPIAPEPVSMQSKTSKPPSVGRPRKPMMSDEFAAVSDEEEESKPVINTKSRKPMMTDELAPANISKPRKPLMSDEFAAVSDDELSNSTAIAKPRKPLMSDEFVTPSDDEPGQFPAAGRPRKPLMSDEFAGASDHDLSEVENLEALEAVRKQMRTPSLSSLPRFDCKKWDEDEDFLQTLQADPVVDARVKKHIEQTKERRAIEQEQARQEWKSRYLDYRRWTDFSDDPVAKNSREKFEKSRVRAAAEAAAPRPSAMPSAGAKPEPQRRTASRWATEHDFERVLRESEQEAKETKEREERVARARTASAKEAKIPDMAWDDEEWKEKEYIDKTHLVPFERSFAALEYGEPIDNFTEEEARIFEETYLEFPKQFSKIAEALPGRDYKACIQHYYLVKHPSNLKEKLKKQPKKKKGRKAGGPKPKSNALMADLGVGRDEAEDGQDGENGERRRPRRAAAPVWPFETPASESEVASPAPTPGRKTAAAPKVDANGDAAPPKRKTKVPREKGAKQSKNTQLLAAAPAAPAAPASRRPESPAPPSTSSDWKNRREPGAASRFPPQYDGAGDRQPTFAPPYVPAEKPNPSLTVNFDVMPQPFPSQERLGSAPPINFESQQDRRNIQQTSSYWSVPEQTDFPQLLRHFGTDWHGIAKWMTSKTHIMVYTTVFQQWLVVPSDSNKSRRVANIQTQVKNYYQRQVDSGKTKEWEDIARDADDKKSRGEETGPLPQPTILPKRRYDMPPGNVQRSGSAMEGVEDMASAGQTSLTHTSPPQPTLSTRFPALAQAGTVAQNIQPATAASVLNKHLPPQPIPQAQQTVQPQQSRAPRGPAMGYFTTDTPSRPSIQADTVSQRSLKVAQEAQLERESALRLEREQREQQQQQQQQAMQRERHFQMKQEPEVASVHQYEPYANPSMHNNNNPSHSRPDPPKPIPAAAAEMRRTAPPQQFPPRPQQPGRSFLGDNVGGPRDMKSSPSPALPRAPMSAPPTGPEAYSAPPPPQPAPVAAIRQEAVRKTSSIMSLLNDDEPSDPRPTPSKRASDISVSSLHASQPTHTPPPQHPLQTSRYAAHSSQPPSQASSQIPQQMGAQPGPQPQHSYAQPAPHSLHQHTSSLGHPRSYTPTGFDNRVYVPPAMQQQQQQQMYSQAPRQPMSSQPQPVRREPAHSDVHGISGGYARTAAPPQPRLKDSPYSATPPPPQQPTIRQAAGSPHELAQSSEREYYQRPPQYLMQQQQSAAGSPQLGPTYQSQQQPSNHRHLAFGQGQGHVASPPTQYATQRPLHRSRGNSFDGRYQMATTSAPTPVQQSYAQAPHHPGTPVSMQYQQQQHPVQDRYPPPQDAEVRMQGEVNYQRQRQRELEQHGIEQRRLEDQRRLEEHRRMEEQRRLEDSRRF